MPVGSFVFEIPGCGFLWTAVGFGIGSLFVGFGSLTVCGLLLLQVVGAWVSLQFRGGMLGQFRIESLNPKPVSGRRKFVQGAKLWELKNSKLDRVKLSRPRQDKAPYVFPG